MDIYLILDEEKLHVETKKGCFTKNCEVKGIRKHYFGSTVKQVR